VDTKEIQSCRLVDIATYERGRFVVNTETTNDQRRLPKAIGPQRGEAIGGVTCESERVRQAAKWADRESLLTTCRCESSSVEPARETRHRDYTMMGETCLLNRPRNCILSPSSERLAVCRSSADRRRSLSQRILQPGHQGTHSPYEDAPKYADEVRRTTPVNFVAAEARS